MNVIRSILHDARQIVRALSPAFWLYVAALGLFIALVVAIAAYVTQVQPRMAILCAVAVFGMFCTAMGASSK